MTRLGIRVLRARPCVCVYVEMFLKKHPANEVRLSTPSLFCQRHRYGCCRLPDDVWSMLWWRVFRFLWSSYVEPLAAATKLLETIPDHAFAGLGFGRLKVALSLASDYAASVVFPCFSASLASDSF